MAQASSEQKRHFIERLYDNMWLWLIVGVLAQVVSYTAWGWFELSTIKPATLP